MTGEITGLKDFFVPLTFILSHKGRGEKGWDTAGNALLGCSLMLLRAGICASAPALHCECPSFDLL